MNLSGALSRLHRRGRVGLVAGPVGFVLLGLALAAAGLPAKAAWTGATVLLMAIWWITEPFPLWATALLPLIVFPLIGAGRLADVAVQYLDPVNFLFLGGMWIAASMEHWELHRRLALGIVARIGVSPRRVVLGFMVATAFVSLWISNTAAAVMMFPIGMAVLERFAEQRGADDPEHRRFGMALMLGIGISASLGGIGSKIGTGTNLIFVKEAQRLLGLDISFLTWFQIGLPVALVAVPGAWLYLARVRARLPPSESPGAREIIAQARARLGKMTRGELVALIAFLAAVLLWVFRQDMDFGIFTIPGWGDALPWSWSEVLGRPVRTLPPPFAELLGPRGAESVVAMIIGLALMVFPITRRPLQMALPLNKAAKINWGLLGLLGGGFAMAYGVAGSGLSAALATTLERLGNVPPLLALIAVCLATVAMSEVASNTATASILLPLLAGSAAGFGLHPATLMFAVTLSASFGFMLPAGTPPNAVVFSSGYISSTQMARAGVVIDFFGAILVAVLSYFLVPMALKL
jgi:solute carrier family 13 (sodium-dependent dicarboxylate transporter), member 2/3/5